MLIRMGRQTAGRRAIAATEFAIVVPFLAMLFCFCIDFTRIFYYSQALETCAENGAMWASNPVAQKESSYVDVTTAAQADFPSNVRTSLSVSSTTSGNYTLVTCSYNFVPIVQYPIPGTSGPFRISRTGRAWTVPATY